MREHESLRLCGFVYGVLVHVCVQTLSVCGSGSVMPEGHRVVCIVYGVLVHVCILEFVSV